MPTKTEIVIEKLAWESDHRAIRSGKITETLEHALQSHIDGRNKDAIDKIASIPEAERGAAAWRVLGHAEHARNNYEAAKEAHFNARDHHLIDDDQDAASDDEVNIAAVFISEERYEEAWAAMERGRKLSPKSPSPWLPRISILNRQERTADLERELRTLLAEMPEFVASRRFKDHLENDTDFIGVDNMIKRIRSGT